MPERTIRTLLACAAMACGATAWADDHRRPRPPLAPSYVRECGSCHVAYAPRLLPAASWQRLMDGLERHCGSDASLDPAFAAELRLWLTQHAAADRKRSEEPPEDRITRAGWFRREHRGLAAPVWQSAKVGSPANCAACHTRAADGSYREREIRLPR